MKKEYVAEMEDSAGKKRRHTLQAETDEQAKAIAGNVAGFLKLKLVDVKAKAGAP